MDVEHFLTALSERVPDPAALSLALVGYRLNGRTLSDTDLRARLQGLALALGHATTDLHTAARWRNEPTAHGRIIALAAGKYPGVSTLAHFPRASARTLVETLLAWAQTPEAGLATTSAQKDLLEALASSSALAPLLSLGGVAAFFAVWKAGQAQDPGDAPRRALPQLGLLPDHGLFGTGDVAERLLRNFRATNRLIQTPGHKFDESRNRVRRGRSARRTARLGAFERAETLRLRMEIPAYEALDLNEVLDIIHLKDDPPDDPPPDSPPDDPPPDDEEDTDEPRDVLGPGHLSREAGASLIDGNDDALRDMTAGVAEALADAVDGNEEAASGEYRAGDDEHRFEFKVDHPFLTCIKYFCSSDDWGGFFEAKTASLEAALRDFSECERIRVQPHRDSLAHEGERYDHRQVISAMQQALHDEGATTQDFCALWDRIVDRRRIVLARVDLLIHQPLLAMAGDPALRDAARELIQDWERLYGLLFRYHDAMQRIDHVWTRMLLEAIASLDVVQIETRIDAHRSSWKAILLPTHPLHLWRYERMAELARGLGLDGVDRKAVLEQLRQPEHYLGVLYLTSLPEGRGGSQPLPVARDHRGLAVFENLKNAYSGSDGIEALQRCVRQFPQIYVNHAQPLRLALVNPPNASEMLLKLLNDKRGRRGTRSTLLVDIYATEGHEARLLGARRFSSEDRDQIEEHIATGRLRLRVHDEVVSRAEQLAAFHERPVHILAVFDEASTEMRRQPGGTNLLPMSPFAIRRRITYLGIRKKVELRPSMEGTVFRSFYDVLGKIDDRTGQTPQASADAERMRAHIETVLTHPKQGAIWFFFADRALPSPGGVRVARILERRDGRRRSVCYDASYARLALLLKLPLDQFNLSISDEQVANLLKEGVALLGDGLIDLFRTDGQPDSARVRGFAGMLVAARDYRERFPEALVVSVDTDLARLWLRLSRTGERCDLLALRKHDGVLVVEAIEVKTVGAGVVAQADIQKASNQLTSTLDAIRTGLQENEQSTPLAAPRQEMLKEVFVSGCQSLTATSDDRARWAEWLQTLFGEADGASDTALRGTVYAVELLNNGTTDDKPLAGQPHDLWVRWVREAGIQKLVSTGMRPPEDDDSAAGAEPPAGDAPAAGEPPLSPPSDPGPAAAEGARGQPERKGATSPSPRRRPQADRASEALGLRFAVGESLRAGPAKPFHLHPGNTRLNQLNIGIVGDLGTGKTQLTQALIYRFASGPELNRGHAPKFLIFDYKRDYTKPDFVDAVQARVVTPHRIPLNIFDLRAAGDHTPAARLGRVKFLNDALQKIYGGIGPRQRNHLKTAVMQGYENAPGNVPTLVDVLRQYEAVVGDRVDAPYSILSDLVDLEIFVDRAAEAVHFNDFFIGVTVIDLASLGIGDRERNMLLVLLLNLYYEYMLNLEKRPYTGRDPQLRFIDSMLLVDEADNIMKYNFEVLRQILLQGREFGVGVLLASQYLSHFRTREIDYSEPLLTWFVHKVPNVTARELEAIGLNRVPASTVEQVKTLDVHECLYKTFDVPGRFIRSWPFHAIVGA